MLPWRLNLRRRVSICGVNTSTLPKLSAKESKDLLIKIRGGDECAKDYFIYCNMRLVLSVTQRFMGCKENIDDIFQVGCVGLIKAIDNFDLTLEVKFSTYAVPMIIGEVKRFLRDSSSLRVSRSLRDVAYQVLKSKEKLSKEKQDEVSLEDVATDLNITLREVSDAIDAIADPVSLDEPAFTDSDDGFCMQDCITENENFFEKWMDHTDLKDAIRNLDEREREILNLRYFIGKTQMEVSDSIGISQAQVSRLEKNALESIKKYISFENL